MEPNHARKFKCWEESNESKGCCSFNNVSRFTVISRFENKAMCLEGMLYVGAMFWVRKLCCVRRFVKRRIQSNGIKFYYHIMGYNG